MNQGAIFEAFGLVWRNSGSNSGGGATKPIGLRNLLDERLRAGRLEVQYAKILYDLTKVPEEPGKQHIALNTLHNIRSVLSLRYDVSNS